MLNSIIESFENDNSNKNKLTKYINIIINPIKYYLIILLLLLICNIYYIINIDTKLKIIQDNL